MESEVTTDGRAARRERNRTAVLDAVIQLFEEGDDDPAVEAISERSGVSTRSVYRYFHHRDELIRAALWHLASRVQPETTLTDIGVGTFEERRDRFVRHRLEMHLRLGPLTRSARRTSSLQELIAEGFDAARRILGAQFREHFAEELSALPDDVREQVVITSYLFFQFDSLEYLCDAYGGDLGRIQDVLGEQLALQFGVPVAVER